jgi:ribosomal protein S18 acetylase RimI-like enzyme
MNIARLVPAHAVAYRALMLEAYELDPDAFTSSVAERAALPLSWWESRLDESPLAPELVFGAFEGGQLAGVAGLSFELREKARHKATLFGMYVPPRFRNRGLGGQLVEAVLAEARARSGVMLVQLTVTDGNRAAQELYAQAGFVVFGVEPLAVAVGATFVSKVHMWRNLGKMR